MKEPVHIISLGAGVQSSTMALMAAHGEISPMPVAAIFADTGNEPQSVYRWLDWLEKELPFPVRRVSKMRGGKPVILSSKSLEMHQTKDGRSICQMNIPFFTLDDNGGFGMVPFRGCTADFKIEPIRKAQRELGNVRHGQKNVGVIAWIGISADEASRMKNSRDPWVLNRYPLIEKRLSRQDCLNWMEANHYPRPPRSACVFCPFHSDYEWRRLKTEEPKEFEKAVRFEQDVQQAKANSGNFRTIPFLHASRQPLNTVDFRNAEDRGQINMFENECEGMCGV